MENNNTHKIIKQGMQALNVEDFKAELANGTLILDTRAASEFTQGFIPESIFIGLEGRFDEWAVSLLDLDKPLLLVIPTGKEEETVSRIARLGFKQIKGFLNLGFNAWLQSGEPIDMIIDIEADELAMDLPHDAHLQIVDVRSDTEFANGHIKGALNLPLPEMTDPAQLANFEENQNLYIHCAAGYRSVIAASMFKKQGIHNIRNILGGWEAISRQQNIPIEKDKTALN